MAAQSALLINARILAKAIGNNASINKNDFAYWILTLLCHDLILGKAKRI